MTQTLTRRSFLSLRAASLVGTRLGAVDAGTSPLVYIGSTTRKAGDGIHVGRWNRQASPHAHGVAISPNNRFVYINDLGTDRIFIYKLNAATAELAANDTPFLAMAAGSGPRHLAFHPNGRWAYSINELNPVDSPT